MHVSHKVHDFGLCAARAVNHAVDIATVTVQDGLHHRCICTRGRKHQTSGIHRRSLHRLGERAVAAIHHFGRQSVVVGFGEFGGQFLAEHVVACRGEAVASHAAVVALLICRLAVGGEAYDNIAGGDAGVVDHIGTSHAACHCAVHDYGAHQVAHVGGLATGSVHAHSEVAQLGGELFGAFDNCCYHLAGNQTLVASDGRREQDAVGGAHAQEVVDVHYHGVLGDAFPHAQVAGTAPVHICQRALCARAVGVHDVAHSGVGAKVVGNYLAECSGKNSFVDVADGIVHVFLACRHTAPAVVSLVHSL